MSGSSKEKKKRGQCHDWSGVVCRALKIGFVWLESSQVFIYTSECAAGSPLLSVCASLCARLDACTYAVFAHLCTCQLCRACLHVRDKEGTEERRRARRFPSAHLPLEFPHGCPLHPLLTTLVHTSLCSSCVAFSGEKSTFVFPNFSPRSDIIRPPVCVRSRV